MPSLPVLAPIRMRRSPSAPGFPRSSRLTGANPTHITLTAGFAEWHSANLTSPPTVGTPMELPYCPIPATTPETR
jgi:hypothetical protein